MMKNQNKINLDKLDSPLIIAGLGNPGEKYNKTRHNAGFIFLDKLAAQLDLTWTENTKLKSWIIKSNNLILMKPMTYMNKSGEAVQAVMSYYKMLPTKFCLKTKSSDLSNNLLVIHDDLDMPLGRIKIVSGGGAGGHKGVRSCIEPLGTRDFPRGKLGIGRPALLIPPEKYVLARFGADEHEIITQKMAAVVDGIKIMVKQGISAAMNAVNQNQ